ncbi:DUF423 domain-containing protein [Psychrosphaera sp. 1_MG-2023]|uniref:DUF423 domain-containing protein n=1 Tax=Psychrosphaera sp. 1_MG-2023 TaxID=3062643 RepID=UPI0026E1C0A1|nr:DUF423 domain-containing protein [Psychrosphaera sp. 1_MG-2023]MDO6718051.1 DUF423 domain-containing protein [Psychrosphaera sp. 1_MG-2023]
MNHYWNFKAIACVLVALSVLAGAFGAHGLKDILTTSELTTWATASNYLLSQGLGILILSCLPQSPKLTLGLKLILFGVITFSVSLFMLVSFTLKIIAMLTPFGGMLMIVGWGVIAWHCFRQYEFTQVK